MRPRPEDVEERLRDQEMRETVRGGHLYYPLEKSLQFCDDDILREIYAAYDRAYEAQVELCDSTATTGVLLRRGIAKLWRAARQAPEADALIRQAVRHFAEALGDLQGIPQEKRELRHTKNALVSLAQTLSHCNNALCSLAASALISSQSPPGAGMDAPAPNAGNGEAI